MNVFDLAAVYFVSILRVHCIYFTFSTERTGGVQAHQLTYMFSDRFWLNICNFLLNAII